ncbi:MAG: prepilin-type N-terminal cleavage/methylation domain-containing protein [Planctomycetaceae bacterium]|nr:prepilin-type N-terminal cleavage/methylation domain-containing protein [Planctomycetaceae bacterium]
MRPSQTRPRSSRRGVTLVEMLVSVALLLLMMTAIAAIFSAATGAASTARVYQDLEGSMRQLDAMIRYDLTGITTPVMRTHPNDPKHNYGFDPSQNYGYFEYSENQFADLQGEDTDDILRFTTEAPEGELFTGRVYLPIPASLLPQANLQVYYQTQPITVTSKFAEVIYFLRNGNLYRRVFLVAPDRQSSIISPNANYPNMPPGQTYISQTSLGVSVGGTNHASWQGMNDLSARPSFNPNSPNMPVLNTLGDLTNRHNRAFYPRFTDDYLPVGSPDGMFDDVNGDQVPDLVPTLYPQVFSANPQLLNSVAIFNRTPTPSADTLAFPYIYPGSYSQPDVPASSNLGQIHGLAPDGSSSAIATPPYGYYYYLSTPYPNTSLGSPPVTYRPNQAPLDQGDNLQIPSTTQGQTWWGLPTWRETLHPNWIDPLFSINVAGTGTQATGLSWTTITQLPPMTDPILGIQPFTEQPTPAGSTTFSAGMGYDVFQDDLIMTGVRSFDVKVYDDAVPGYVDLGYSSFLDGVTPLNAANATIGAHLLETFGHEGRIPPLQADYRVDPQAALNGWGNFFIGDDQAGIRRLRRTYDSWSTAYSAVVAKGVVPGSNAQVGPPFANPPLYPSYPPPYPLPLRGIQIQIRLVDPRNEHIKVLTIRQDFSNKL